MEYLIEVTQDKPGFLNLPRSLAQCLFPRVPKYIIVTFGDDLSIFRSRYNEQLGLFQLGGETFRKFVHIKSIGTGSYLELVIDRNRISLHDFNSNGIPKHGTKKFNSYGCGAKVLIRISELSKAQQYVPQECLKRLNFTDVEDATQKLLLIGIKRNYIANILFDLNVGVTGFGGKDWLTLCSDHGIYNGCFIVLSQYIEKHCVTFNIYKLNGKPLHPTVCSDRDLFSEHQHILFDQETIAYEGDFQNIVSFDCFPRTIFSCTPSAAEVAIKPKSDKVCWSFERVINEAVLKSHSLYIPAEFVLAHNLPTYNNAMVDIFCDQGNCFAEMKLIAHKDTLRKYKHQKNHMVIQGDWRDFTVLANVEIGTTMRLELDESALLDEEHILFNMVPII